MCLIYEPTGKAREYSPRALNIYSGCSHRCKYCYAPHTIQRSQDDYFKEPTPRTALQNLKKELSNTVITEQVLLSFIGDPYTKASDDNMATRQSLQALYEHNVPVAILTKGGKRCLADIDLFKKFGPAIMVGATLTFSNDESSLEWEPGASLPMERLETLKTLKENGIKTFASFEPVIDPEQSLELMRKSVEMDCIDLYKVGKLNGMSSIEKTIDWADFLTRALDILRSANKEIYIKYDLRNEASTVELTPIEIDADAHTVHPRPVKKWF